MPIILIIALLLGGGTTLAARNSLPGDVLYPIKTNINENVSAMFSFGAESEAKFHAEEVATRLEEAEKLAAQGNLSAEVQAGLKASIDKHAEELRDRIAELKAQGDTEAVAEVSAKYETALKARQSALLKIQNEQSGEVKASLDTVLNRVHTEISETSKVRATSSTSVDANAGAQTERTGSTTTETSAGVNASGSVQVDLGI